MKIAKTGFLVKNEVLEAISCMPAYRRFRPDPYQAYIDAVSVIPIGANGFLQQSF